jgi:hypothetical protein
MTATHFHAWLDRIDAEINASATGQLFLAAGYHMQHTGGGCLAWEKVSGDVTVLITGDDGVSLCLDTAPDYWLVGKYDTKSGESLDTDNLAPDRATAAAAIAYGDSLHAATETH